MQDIDATDYQEQFVFGKDGKPFFFKEFDFDGYEGFDDDEVIGITPDNK